MSLRSQFGTNTAKETEGVVIQFGENDDKTIPGFHISRMSRANVRYTKAMEVATRPYKRQIELGTLPNDTSERIFLDVFVRTVLRGWENVLLSDVTGNVKDTGFATFSEDNARKLFSNLPELFEDLQQQAKSASLFKEEEMEADSKN